MTGGRARQLLVLAAASAAATAATPALAHPESDPRRIDVIPLAGDLVLQRKKTLTFEVSDRVTVMVTGGKIKSSGEPRGRWSESSASRPSTSKMPRVGVLFRW